MNTDWSFGDEELPPELPFQAGKPCCYNCGTPAAEGLPDSYARCRVCGFHLHTCPNCMFYNGMACLLREPAFWSESGVIGKFCPSFNWRAEACP